MEIKKIFANKKYKNILITICEILVVAGIIFGALMFIQHKVNKEADKVSGIGGVEAESKTKKADTGSDNYYIEVNIYKNAVIVYQYSKDGKTKKPYKVFDCSIGEELEPGKYKTSTVFSWLDINENWHRYNTKFGDGAWIQSAGYRDKYAHTLDKKSYYAIGDKKSVGKCIMLYAKDAEWIYSKCKTGTVIKVIKGKKSDKLPLTPENSVTPYKYCGWDPTDPDKNNPYQKMENAKIVAGVEEVFVEKGAEPEYVSNLLAKDKKGNNITGKLNYQEIDTSVMGTTKVKFTYKLKSGKTLSLTQKFTVIDTIPPVVSCSKSQFTLEVKSKKEKDINKKSNVNDIIEMVRSAVSCNESGVKITVSTVDYMELREANIPVVIKAQDEAGNIGSLQVMCEIKVEKPKKVKRYKPSKELVDKLEKKYKKDSDKDSEKKKEESEEDTTLQDKKEDSKKKEKETVQEEISEKEENEETESQIETEAQTSTETEAASE